MRIIMPYNICQYPLAWHHIFKKYRRSKKYTISFKKNKQHSILFFHFCKFDKLKSTETFRSW